MAEKIFLHLLFLCGIWSQGIIGTFVHEEVKESSDFLVRQKRVISHFPGEDIPVRINRAPYVVRITEFGRIRCQANILSQYVVITVAPCVPMDAVNYKLLSNAAHIHNGAVHDVTEIRRLMDIHPNHRSFDGIALLTINPPFVFTSFCRPIKLHTGPVLVGSLGKIHGWGFIDSGEDRGTNISKSLRSIEVPVISHQDCVNRYPPHLQMSEKVVCTYHPQRHSGHTDLGAGLVIDGTLAGVFLWSGLTRQIDPVYPDVFAYLHDTHYNQWIRSNVESIDSHFQNLHHH